MFQLGMPSHFVAGSLHGAFGLVSPLHSAPSVRHYLSLPVHCAPFSLVLPVLRLFHGIFISYSVLLIWWRGQQLAAQAR